MSIFKYYEITDSLALAIFAGTSQNYLLLLKNCSKIIHYLE